SLASTANVSLSHRSCHDVNAGKRWLHVAPQVGRRNPREILRVWCSGNICKKRIARAENAATLLADGVPPPPPTRPPPTLGARVRSASGTHRGIASVWPHDTGTPHLPCGQEESNEKIVVVFDGCGPDFHDCPGILRRTASSAPGNSSTPDSAEHDKYCCVEGWRSIYCGRSRAGVSWQPVAHSCGDASTRRRRHRCSATAIFP